MDSEPKLVPFSPRVPRARSVTVFAAVTLMAAGVSHMFTFGLAIDHVPWGDDSPFIELLAMSTLVAGIGLVLLSRAFPLRLPHRVDLVTVANMTALGVGVVSFWLGFLARSFPMYPFPDVNNAAFTAGLLLIVSGVVATICRAPRQVPESSPSGETW